MTQAKLKLNRFSLNLREPCEAHTQIDSTKENERKKKKGASFDITTEYIGTLIAEWK
jgi:hypothetical protein